MKFTFLRSVLVVLVFTLLSFSPASEFKYTSIEGKCSITYPASFESTNKQTDRYTTIKTQAIAEDQLYLLSHSEHKFSIEEHELLALESLESFSESAGGTIINQSSWSIKKHNGIQAVIEISAKNAKAEYRAILIDQIQYQIVVVSDSNTWNQAKADEFIASFKVEK